MQHRRIVRIPSYDDLTPSIPDVSAGDVLGSVGRVLPGSPPVASAAAPVAGAPPSQLFACVRTPRDPPRAMVVARDFSPRVQRYVDGGVVFDVSGLERLLGTPPSIAAELEKAGGADARIAVAPTQSAALLLSRARPSPTVVTVDVSSALASVPLVCLEQLLADIHGVTLPLRGRAAKKPAAARASGWPPWAACEPVFDILRRWGLTTLGEFAALPARDLSARIGQDGLALQHLARGGDLRPLVPDPDVPRYVERIELEWPIDALEPLSFVLPRLLDPLALSLERAGRAAAAVRLALRLVDRTTHVRVLQLPAAMRDPRVLRTLLLLDLESHPPSAAIDIATIEIDPAPARVVQHSLLERGLPSPETLATLTARLTALVGETRCGSPALLDTYRSDGFEMRRFGADGKSQMANGKWNGSIGHESIGDSMCHLPSAISHCAVRRFRPPVAIRVTVERGRPVRVAIDRRGMPGGHVEQCAGPWRSSGSWWERETAHWDRDEWDVALSDGCVCRLFRERGRGGWFLEGILD
jgi:protein ImuB